MLKKYKSVDRLSIYNALSAYFPVYPVYLKCCILIRIVYDCIKGHDYINYIVVEFLSETYKLKRDDLPPCIFNVMWFIPIITRVMGCYICTEDKIL